MFCEEYKGGFEGGRKCIKGGCGGMEKEILEPYLAKHGNTSSSSTSSTLSTIIGESSKVDVTPIPFSMFH